MFYALLLNSTYECIAFISERKVFKFLLKRKVEVLSDWEHSVFWPSGSMKQPAVLRLKYTVRHRIHNFRFNKHILFMRDLYTCQYCGRRVHKSRLTVDHIVPKSRGGSYSWKNCVAACSKCNNLKDSMTPHEAGMKLLRRPIKPKTRIFYDHLDLANKHDDWSFYIVC